MLKVYRYLPVLLLAVGVCVATSACADQLYGYGGYGGGRSARDIERRAYDYGYREGLQEGQNDARRGRDFSYARHDEYRDADHGYRRSEGDREYYRRSYRQGFQTGYAEAFNRNARGGYGRDQGRNYPSGYPNDPQNRGGYGGYGSPAAQNGYRDGLEAGRKDARDRERFDPVRAKRYRDGDHDYDNRYGSRDVYKREYRAAFEQGYREGYGAVRR